MTTFNTGNPVGSTDVYDRYDNSENLDNFSNGPLDAYADRLGVMRQSLQGIRNASQYQVLGAYAAGLQFTSLNQVFSYLGEFYAPGPSIALPYTTTGVGAAEIANFRSVGDAILRADLADSADPAKGASLVGFQQAGTGAVATTVQKKDQRRVDLEDFMSAAQISDASGGTPTLDITSSLQAAVDSLPATGGELWIPPYPVLIKGSYPAGSARVTDGVKLRSNITIRGVEGASEIRQHSSCACTFTIRPLAAYTALSQVPKNIAIYGVKFTRPGQVWDAALENTAHLWIDGVNGMKVQRCIFEGWAGDAIAMGFNNDVALSSGLQTYINNVDISQNTFDGVTNDNRQGISLWCGVDVDIHHNTFIRTTRSAVPSMPGAIDIEPILASALISNIKVRDNTFDTIGGSTGVVSFALSASLTVPAVNLSVKGNVFKNITNVSDVFVIGKSAPGHTTVATNSPDGIVVSGNEHYLPNGGNRRWYVGGVRNLVIEGNTVIGGTLAALLGYDDGGSGHYPINGFTFKNNSIRDWYISGSADSGILFAAGGLVNGDISGNHFLDCGNLTAGVPTNMTVLQIAGNGIASTNMSISENSFINTSAFTANSYPLSAAVLTNPTKIKVQGNTFIGFSKSPYTDALSLYRQVSSDFYIPFVAIPSTATPDVAGAVNFTASTGDTFTSFTGGQEGQIITLLGVASGAVIQHNANVILTAGANFTLSAGKTIRLLSNSSKWYQV